MEETAVLLEAKLALTFVYNLSMPILLTAVAVGLTIALLQAVLSLQEQSLAFVAKLFAIVTLITLNGAQYGAELLLLIDHIFNRITQF